MSDFLRCIGGALLAAAALAPASVSAQAEKPLRWVVPYPAGGGADTISRLLAGRIAGEVGGRVIVENRPGAAGIIGGEYVARAAPDARTVMLVVASHGINAASGRKLPYDTERDFAPVMLVGWGPNIVATHPSLPARSLRDLLALAKARPGEIHYASFGAGSVSHLTGELLKLSTGVDLLHVPYRGAAPAMVDVVGGQVPLAFGSLAASAAYLRAGRLRALAVTSPERSALVPELPTVAESGVPGFATREWWAVFAPAGSPAPALDRINAALAKALAAEEVRSRLAAVGAEAVGGPPDRLGGFMGAEVARWRETIRRAGITLQ